MPSLALIVMVAVPLQFAAGVIVSVAPDMLGVTFEVDEVAVKVCESPVSTSVSDRVTVFAVSSAVV